MKILASLLSHLISKRLMKLFIDGLLKYSDKNRQTQATGTVYIGTYYEYMNLV